MTTYSFGQEWVGFGASSEPAAEPATRAAEPGESSWWQAVQTAMSETTRQPARD